MRVALLLLAACGPEAPDPTVSALAPYPSEPDEILARCVAEPFPELEITCRVQAAATYAQRGQEPQADAACAPIPAGTWSDECHFRVGEELGHAGRTIEALHHCAKAGWYGRNCLTHTAWALPPDPELGPSTAPERVASAALELQGSVDEALAGAGDGLEGEGRDLVMARFGYNLYVGRGSADPGAARLPSPLGAALRTGFAIEAARLLEAPTVSAILAIWRGELPIPSGAPLPAESRMGRYAVPIQSPFEQGVPHVPVYGGGRRMVGETEEEDTVIAALEAMYWLPETPAETFAAWIEDPRPRVRRTAARLMRLATPTSLDMEATLMRIAAEDPDEGVRWHAADGLEHRTWEGRGPLDRLKRHDP